MTQQQVEIKFLEAVVHRLAQDKRDLEDQLGIERVRISVLKLKLEKVREIAE